MLAKYPDVLAASLIFLGQHRNTPEAHRLSLSKHNGYRLGDVVRINSIYFANVEDDHVEERSDSELITPS